MEELGCPRCKSTKYRNPSLKLMVNVCGHTLCENCVELLFIRGSGACPECGTALRRSNFRAQQFEDAFVEKEVDIRKRILKDFNKREEDFTSLREYNDYLEMVETIIINLTTNTDLEATKRQIEKYKKENKEAITKNKSKLSKDDEYLQMLLEQEAQEALVRHNEVQQEELRVKNQKKRNKEALIDELMSSDSSAVKILARHQAEVDKLMAVEASPKKATTAFSTGIQVGTGGDLGMAVNDVSTAYVYTPIIFDTMGPNEPTLEEVMSLGYLSNVRETTEAEKGSGYQASYACMRALRDALGGLFHRCDVPPVMESVCQEMTADPR